MISYERRNQIKIQCLECGQYFAQISHLHLEKCCNLTPKQYKEKYPDAVIVSEETRRKISENHLDMSGENNPNYKGGIVKQRREQRYNRRQNGISCLECNNYYESLVPAHLKSHWLSIIEYIEKYPDAKLMTDEVYLWFARKPTSFERVG